MNKMKKIVSFIKHETVLSAALILALVSAFIVPPSSGYLNYIDFRTLAILFCLMSVMAGLQKIGVFSAAAQKIILKVKSAQSLVLILVMLCFFTSMFITNDVALITFVPFTFAALEMSGEKDRLLIPVTAMQTVAANLGSMLTPVGNPQNLYLYTQSGMSVTEFLLLMLPYTAASFLLILAWCVARRDGKRQLRVTFESTDTIENKRGAVIYLILFIICLLCVARVIPYSLVFVLVILSIAVFDRKTLLKIDYSLLLTFIGFFIFIGNMGQIDAFRRLLQNFISGREVVTSIAASQVISNVPAAILLSGFTERFDLLIIGTNLGGLGTLIASMASLISFKYIARENKSLRGKYILYFTAINIVFLAVLTAFYFIIK